MLPQRGLVGQRKLPTVLQGDPGRIDPLLPENVAVIRGMVGKTYCTCLLQQASCTFLISSGFENSSLLFPIEIPSMAHDRSALH